MFGPSIAGLENSRSSTSLCALAITTDIREFPQEARALLPNAIYLENTGVTIDNVTFWGHRILLSS